MKKVLKVLPFVIVIGGFAYLTYVDRKLELIFQ